MRNEDILNIVRQCNLHNGKVLIPNKAYLFNQEFKIKIVDKTRYERVEIIVLVENGVKVGGIYRMGCYDIHCVLYKKYRGQHIMSTFFKTGIINKIWPENKSVKLCDVYTRDEYNKKKYLAKLIGMTIKNEIEIEKILSYFDEQRLKYASSNSE